MTQTQTQRIFFEKKSKDRNSEIFYILIQPPAETASAESDQDLEMSDDKATRDVLQRLFRRILRSSASVRTVFRGIIGKVL